MEILFDKAVLLQAIKEKSFCSQEIDKVEWGWTEQEKQKNKPATNNVEKKEEKNIATPSEPKKNGTEEDVDITFFN